MMITDETYNNVPFIFVYHFYFSLHTHIRGRQKSRMTP